jgi:hypothetical protein
MLPGIVCQLFDVGTLEESIVTMWSYLGLSRGYTLKSLDQRQVRYTPEIDEIVEVKSQAVLLVDHFWVIGNGT